jgi:hypothetical protein
MKGGAVYHSVGLLITAAQHLLWLQHPRLATRRAAPCFTCTCPRDPCLQAEGTWP